MSVTAALLTPWLLLRLALGIYFFGDLDSDYAPERMAARLYLGYLAIELALAVCLSLASWWVSRRVGRNAGRPTGRDIGVLAGYAILLVVLTADAFTFMLPRLAFEALW